MVMMFIMLVSCVTMVTVQLKVVGMFIVFSEFNIDTTTSHELTIAITLRATNVTHFLVPGSKP